ncbi:MAG: polysaccharide deacetylase family protein [Terriglobia bacterium]
MMKTISRFRSLGICLAFASLLLAGGSIQPAPASAQAPAASGAMHRKLIALTFDDGPKPYVLMGRKLQNGASSPGLLDLLDREGVKATFFVMGFRLADTANDFCRQTDVGINCRQAAEEEHRRGHEIENHTYGHGPFSKMAKRYGENWVLNDIDRASRIIQSVTGVRPRYVRPPDWDVWETLREKIEARGYHLMTKSKGDVSEAPALEDVDSQDYIYAKLKSPLAAAKTEHDYVVQRIEQRERKGVSTHILVFHELPISVEVLSTLIPELKKRGYEFVPLRDYMKTLGATAK